MFINSNPLLLFIHHLEKAEELAEYLKLNKIVCGIIITGLDPIIRKKIQEDFIEDRLPLIIATNAFGMGIDKKDIRLVIHFNSPGSIENYYQEIGRSGRDGKNSHTFYCMMKVIFTFTNTLFLIPTRQKRLLKIFIMLFVILHQLQLG